MFHQILLYSSNISNQATRQPPSQKATVITAQRKTGFLKKCQPPKNKGILVENCCGICQEQGETIQHLLFDCPHIDIISEQWQGYLIG